MYACYHTHSARCRHAEGADEEYIKVAISRGVKLLGFSDHAPMRYPAGYVSSYKMLPDEIDEYFSSLAALREKYKNEIEIKIGFETEYYPDLFDDCIDFWSKYPIDYLILGQHFARDERYVAGAVYSGDSTENKDMLREYTDNVIKGINTGKITYVAHPDLFNYVGDDEDFFRSEISRLITACNRLSMPLELNLLGLSEGRAYPRDIFWREAARLGAKAIIGCDAHSPDRVAKPEEIAAAQRFAERYGVELVEKVELRPVI